MHKLKTHFSRLLLGYVKNMFRYFKHYFEKSLSLDEVSEKVPWYRQLKAF